MKLVEAGGGYTFSRNTIVGTPIEGRALPPRPDGVVHVKVVSGRRVLSHRDNFDSHFRNPKLAAIVATFPPSRVGSWLTRNWG